MRLETERVKERGNMSIEELLEKLARELDVSPLSRREVLKAMGA